jgi:NADPH-dependent 2,4-dienoyl-CoA reductase/sulfur reductase-like enzyme
MAERLVVIGGDAGGMTAAAMARRLRPDLDVVALERGAHMSYSACGIPYLVAGDIDDLDDLVVVTPDRFRAEYNIDARTRHEVTALDLDARQVEVRDHEHDRTYKLGFDTLLVATGARPVRPDLPGIDGDTIHGVQTLDDAERLLADADRRPPRAVTVVGGGYIGLEMAEAFVRRGAAVTLVEAAPEVMRTLDTDMAAMVHKAMEAFGIDVRTGVAVEGFEPGRVLTAAGPVEADLVVLGLGVQPNSELAGDAGVALGARGAISVNRRQQTSADGVWAAGDCCDSFHLVSQRNVHVALGTVANKQGRVAGINIGGGYATFPGVVGTAVTKVCSTEVARTGLTETEAARDGFAYEAVTIESTTRAGYFPGTKPITVKVVAERDTGRLLGAQIVGEEGAAKRIDVFATALTARLTVFDMISLDLSYAPPFSSVWDPVLVAARKAVEAVERGR